MKWVDLKAVYLELLAAATTVVAWVYPLAASTAAWKEYEMETLTVVGWDFAKAAEKAAKLDDLMVVTAAVKSAEMMVNLTVHVMAYRKDE